MIVDVIDHYDRLIDEGQDPVNDSLELQAYMNKWDGETFIKLLELDKSKKFWKSDVVQADWLFV